MNNIPPPSLKSLGRYITPPQGEDELPSQPYHIRPNTLPLVSNTPIDIVQHNIAKSLQNIHKAGYDYFNSSNHLVDKNHQKIMLLAILAMSLY